MFENDLKSEKTRKRKEKIKKPFYQRKRFWILICFIAFCSVAMKSNIIDDSETKITYELGVDKMLNDISEEDVDWIILRFSGKFNSKTQEGEYVFEYDEVIASNEETKAFFIVEDATEEKVFLTLEETVGEEAVVAEVTGELTDVTMDSEGVKYFYLSASEMEILE